MIMERRFNPNLKVELRESPDGNTLTGYIAVFNTDSCDMGGYVERLAPGCFTNSLAANDIVALVNHDNSDVVGRTSSGTLRLSQDARGLYFEVDLPDTQAARDLKVLVSRKDLLGCSFGFWVDPADMSWSQRDGKDVCTVSDLDLVEVSVGVTMPAYEATSMALRDRKRKQGEREKVRAKWELIKTTLYNTNRRYGGQPKG